MVDIGAGYKGPPGVGGIIVRHNGLIGICTRAQRSPAIVLIVAPPAYPGRGPFRIRNPDPTIIIGECPSAVVERSPAPIVIRYPGIPVFGHGPMSFCAVRMEVFFFNIRYPYIPVFRVVHPLSIRLQFVVEGLKRYLRIVTRLGGASQRCYREKEQKNGRGEV